MFLCVFLLIENNIAMHFNLPKDGGLKEVGIPQPILHSYEKIPAEIYTTPEDASAAAADLISEGMETARKEGRLFRLGLSTGRTPRTLFQILSQRCLRGEISFKDVEIVTIDEYYPFDKSGVQSRNHTIHSDLLDHIDILPENVHIPDSSVDEAGIASYCETFDSIARGLDLLVMGIGENGQVGFNEAGAARQSRTRTVLLPYSSRKRQAKNFIGAMADTPKMAITMGIGTMMSAGKVILMAFGEDKAAAVKAAAENDPSSSCPASYFQEHQCARIFVDDNAAGALTRVEAPWLIGPCDWTVKFKRKAVVWLCRTVGKPILALTQQDYLENSLGELLEMFGPYDKINIDVFNDLQHTITGWPGGKPGTDDSFRPVSAVPYPKTVLIFSPHPDDDVISMGGTFIRLVHQGHNVHVAYETSGNVAVHDDVVTQMLDAAVELGLGDIKEDVAGIIHGKKAGEPEPRRMLEIKAAIRRSEAKAAVRSFGLDVSHVHFLNLPFYESGGVKKLPRSQKDVDIVKALITEIHPDQIYMAGDLADPHGTHRVCTEVALEAIEQLRSEGAGWLDDCTIWMYRGAWMEWEIGRVDMAVPLSPDEVVEKRYAIYHHLSQKDIVPFPGDDPREFWQRAEDRTAGTAAMYRELGMAKYQSMEVFMKLVR